MSTTPAAGNLLPEHLRLIKESQISDEVAEILRLKPQTVRDAAWRGKIPCVRLWAGRKKTLLRFKSSAIRQLIEERSIDASHAQDGD